MLTFQRFETLEEAEGASKLLQTEGIPVEIENVHGILDSNFIGKEYGNNVFLKIPQEDFNRARQLLIDHTPVDISTVDKDYMLFSLSNEELEEVLAKPDEWGAYNYNLAKAILQQRNVSVDNKNIETLREERIQQMAEPKTIDSFWVMLTYALVVLCLIKTFLLSFVWIGIFWMVPVYCAVWGWAVSRTRKTLPDGNRIFAYDTPSRKHGNIIFLGGIITVLLTFIVPIVLLFSGR
ncbi:hypothetical protein [Taibaiella soli]|uniref:Uncharacterized protein n=1 Tax=Taibaiella soli TaxID=1649169 RepID=A0A2W2BT10_9BACT|nr:hypothetical protein [Taibaiella soli]PZF70893.1 hypothetical protein DN068_20930 [Taibaiella soli]